MLTEIEWAFLHILKNKLEVQITNHRISVNIQELDQLSLISCFRWKTQLLREKIVLTSEIKMVQILFQNIYKRMKVPKFINKIDYSHQERDYILYF